MNSLYRFKLLVSFCIVVGFLMNSGTGFSVSAACAGWNVVPSPNGGPDNQLYGVTAVSTTDAWAVGGYINSHGNNQTLIEHWNGRTWTIVASPNVARDYNILYGVVAVSTNDVWAVGAYDGSNGNNQALIEHWNGKTWTVVSSPDIGIGSSLHGMAVVSPTTIWAVGYAVNAQGIEQTLIEQWNGTRWSVVPGPNPGSYANVLWSVSAHSPGTVWAAGDYSNSRGQDQSLIEQWNGSQWGIVKSPDVSQFHTYLLAVTALSPTNAWAVGYALADNLLAADTVVEQWNGSQWSLVPAPDPGTAFNFLYALTAISPTSIWAVGTYSNSRYGPFHTLAEQWNGSQWLVHASPGPGATINTLAGVAAAPASTVWTVGFDSDALGGPHRTLTEHFC